jgi:hypothetical protein
MEKRG